jgi:hypothetical protein
VPEGENGERVWALVDGEAHGRCALVLLAKHQQGWESSIHPKDAIASQSTG